MNAKLGFTVGWSLVDAGRGTELIAHATQRIRSLLHEEGAWGRKQPKLAAKYGDWEFRTKHELGVALLTWFMRAITALGVKVTSTNTSFSAVTSTTSIAGTYDITVNQLAKLTRIPSVKIRAGRSRQQRRVAADERGGAELEEVLTARR
mgnify:CR=1 FL=1